MMLGTAPLMRSTLCVCDNVSDEEIQHKRTLFGVLGILGKFMNKTHRA